MSGKDALSICERAECDLVLLDVMMPAAPAPSGAG
jgi:CheY-like chemotaxis protein